MDSYFQISPERFDWVQGRGVAGLLLDNHRVFMAAYLDNHTKHFEHVTCKYPCCKVPQNI